MSERTWADQRFSFSPRTYSIILTSRSVPFIDLILWALITSPASTTSVSMEFSAYSMLYTRFGHWFGQVQHCNCNFCNLCYPISNYSSAYITTSLISITRRSKSLKRRWVLFTYGFKCRYLSYIRDVGAVSFPVDFWEFNSMQGIMCVICYFYPVC